ncbi:MAG: response regulator transcription factor [Clostridia bacterium]|nr:response regulator transcription factor [Clostridia bacterium]
MNCIIVDDERPAREELRYFIEKFSSIEIAAEFEDGVETVDYLSRNRVDVAFLDISMPMMTGIEIASVIRKTNPVVLIVFVTAHRDFAVDAFGLTAFDYILKPIAKDRIIELFSRINAALIPKDKSETKTLSKLSFWEGDRIFVIDVNDILYLEANERNSTVATIQGNRTIHENISNISDKLPEIFFRCHRSYTVNLSMITVIEPWFNNTYMLSLKDCGVKIPVSKSRIKDFNILMRIK